MTDAMNHAEVIRDWMAHRGWCASRNWQTPGPCDCNYDKTLAALDALTREAETAKASCRPPEATRQKWIATADDPNLTEAERASRLKGESYLTNCDVSLRGSSGQTIVYAENMDGCVIIGLDGYVIMPKENFAAQSERIATLEELLTRAKDRIFNSRDNDDGNEIPFVEEIEAALAPKEAQEPDLSKCPKCGGPADNGHDRCLPPSPYYCARCQEAQG